MKILLLQLVSFFAFVVPACAIAQEDSSRALASVDKYALRIVIDAEHHSLEGEAEVLLRMLKDSVLRIHLTLGPSTSLLSARDSADRKLETAEESSPGGIPHREISIGVPDTSVRGDVLVVRLHFTEEFDSVVSHSSFITPKEIFLSADEHGAWWPTLSDATNPLPAQTAAVELEVTVSSAFTIVANGEPDSLRTEGPKTTERFAYTSRMPLKSCFLICGSPAFTTQSITGADNFFRCTLYYNPEKFSAELAGSVLRQMRRAHEFFSSMAVADSSYSAVRIAVVGAEDGLGDWVLNNGLLVVPNLYSYSAGDSTLLSSPSRKNWVHELARVFSLASTDSTFLFGGGWLEYLTTKFFIHEANNDADTQQQIRLALLSRTLDFFPAQPLAQEHRSKRNEQAVFFSKGAYVFMMLEYVIGEAAFDSVTAKLYRNFKYTPVTLTEYQRLCEEAYGSPLDWFFREWVSQTGFPEFILSTEIAQTSRGSYLLKARISQRGDVFTSPLDLVFSNSVRSITKRVFAERQDQEFEFILPFLPTKSELDPKYYILRWVPRLRLLAHARTSVSFRVFDRDVANSEREANVLLQLDPNNITGWNNIAFFSLGKAAAIRGDLSKAEEYFRRASGLEASDPTQLLLRPESGSARQCAGDGGKKE